MIDTNGIIQAPVSIEDVRKTLGVESYDLATLCTSSKINEWSKYRPIQANQPYEITLGGWRDLNYGYTIYSYDNRADVWNAYASGKKWINNPAINNYRLTDFIGYDAGAKSPLTASIVWDITEKYPHIGSVITIDCDGLSDLLDWGFMSQYAASSYSGINAGMLCSNGYYYPFTGTRGANIQDILFDRLAIPVDASVFNEGETYSFCPTFTTWSGDGTSEEWIYVNGSDKTGTWWLLPVNDLSVTINQNQSLADVINVFHFITDSLVIKKDGSYYTYSDFDFGIGVSIPSDFTGYIPNSITFNVYVLDTFIYSYTLSSVSAGYYGLENVVYAGTIYSTYYNGRYVECKVQIVYSGSGNDLYRYIDLEATTYP